MNEPLMDLDVLLPALEAVIFAAAVPVSVEELSRTLQLPDAYVRRGIARLEHACEQPNRGLTLAHVGGGYQFVTKPSLSQWITRLAQRPKESGLSQAAFEALAIIAYKQPITKAEIEAIRGVRSDSAVEALLARRLVEEVGRKEAPGRPVLYGTSREFLLAFGLPNLEALPKPDDLPIPSQGELPLQQSPADLSRT